MTQRPAVHERRRDPARVHPCAAIRRGCTSPTTGRRASSRPPRWWAPATRSATFRAGRATLCAGPDDLVRFAPRVRGVVRGPRAAAAHGAARDSRARSARRCRWASRARPAARTSRRRAGRGQRARGAAAPRRRGAAARREGAARRDDPRRCDPRPPRRRARRRTPWRRGEIDVHRTLRTTLRQMGEPGRVEHRRRGTTAGGWCCWSTSPPRCVPTPTPCCGWRT